MGRINILGGRNPFGPVNPFRGLDAFGGEPSTSDLLPDVSPAREADTIGALTEAGLGGLAYLGKLADKTFGGRAVRGVLGGRPRELLSVLPFSDTLGLTDEDQTVRGRDLLQGVGLVRPEDDSFGFDDLLGIGAEIALDPATYLGIGPLTRAGTLAKQARNLPGGISNRIAGFTAAESQLLPFAQAAGKEVRDLVPEGASILSRQAEDAARLAGEEIRVQSVFDPVANALKPNPAGPATPLGGVVGFGLPFSKPLVTFGAGPGGQQFLDAVGTAGRVAAAPLRLADRAIDSATGFSPARTAAAAFDPLARTARALFDPTVKGATSAEGQAIGRFAFDLEKQLARNASGARVDVLNQLDPLLEKGEDASRAVLESIVQKAEGAGPIARYRPDQRLAQYFTPAEIDQVNKVTADVADLLVKARETNLKLGINEPDLVDNAINYLTRSKTLLPKNKGETFASYTERAARHFAAEHASLIARDDLFKNLPGGTTQINELARNPALSGANRLLNGAPTTDLQAQAIIRAELSPAANPPPEVYKQAEKLNDWLKTLDPVYAEKGVDFFTIDVPSNVFLRLTRGNKAQVAAEAAYEGVRRFSKPIAEFQAAGERFVPVTDLLARMKLTGKDAQGADIATQIVSNRTGTALNDVAGLAVPERMAIDILKYNEAFTNPSALKPIVDAWDYVTNLFKTSVTAPFVSFHTRNVATALFNMWRGDVFGNDPRKLAELAGEAWDVTRGYGIKVHLPGMDPNADATQQLIKELVQGRVAFTPRSQQSLGDLTGAAGETVLKDIRRPVKTGNTALQDAKAWARGLVPKSWEEANPFNIAGVNREEDVFSIVRQARAAGQQLEDWSRVTHYIGLRKKGFSAEAAAEEVAKYQIDYSRLTSFERNVMKRLFPWYAFSRRNIPPLLEDLATQPAKVTAALRGATGGRERGEFVPGYIAEGATIPTPGAPEGQQRYVSSLGLPFEDEAVKAAAALGQGKIGRALEATLGMTLPAIKAPLEFAFNKQLYTGRPLEELRPYEFSTLGGLLPERAGRIATQVVSNTPLSRTAATVNRLLDERKGPLAQVVNLLTGLRITDVDYQRAQDAATKKMIGDLLRGQSGVRTTSDVYVPKELIPGLSPEDQLRYRLYLNANERLRDAARERRAGLPGL